MSKRFDNAKHLKDEFIAYRKDNYSHEACEAMLSYFEKNGIELDIADICEQFIELNFEEISDNYEILQDCTWSINTTKNKILFDVY